MKASTALGGSRLRCRITMAGKTRSVEFWPTQSLSEIVAQHIGRYYTGKRQSYSVIRVDSARATVNSHSCPMHGATYRIVFKVTKRTVAARPITDQPKGQSTRANKAEHVMPA